MASKKTARTADPMRSAYDGTPLGTLPQPTPVQRVRAMHDLDLVLAAERLAPATDAASVEALRLVTTELARRGIAGVL